MFDSTECLMITFSLCHMVGVSTCCTNPVLYGFLNPNFNNVYKNICCQVIMIIEVLYQYYNDIVKGEHRMREGFSRSRTQLWPLTNISIRDNNFTFCNTNPSTAATSVWIITNKYIKCACFNGLEKVKVLDNINYIICSWSERNLKIRIRICSEWLIYSQVKSVGIF